MKKIPTLTNRLPNKREFYLAVSVSVFFIHIWSFVTYFYTVPGLILSRSLGELADISAYILADALFESVLLSGVIALFCLLPWSHNLRENFVPLSTLLISALSISAAIFHFLKPVSQAITDLLNQWQVNYISVIFILLSFLLIGLIFTIIFSSRWITNHNRFRHALSSFADRVSLLATLFLALDFISLVVIIIRNII